MCRNDGTNVDPDGDGNPGNNSDPTPVTFDETPEIGTAKDVSAGPTNNGDGTFTLTYTVTVENTGDVPLNSVQVVDDLATTFAGATRLSSTRSPAALWRSTPASTALATPTCWPAPTRWRPVPAARSM